MGKHIKLSSNYTSSSYYKLNNQQIHMKWYCFSICLFTINDNTEVLFCMICNFAKVSKIMKPNNDICVSLRAKDENKMITAHISNNVYDVGWSESAHDSQVSHDITAELCYGNWRPVLWDISLHVISNRYHFITCSLMTRTNYLQENDGASS